MDKNWNHLNLRLTSKIEFKHLRKRKISVLTLFTTFIIGALFMLIKMPIEFVPSIQSPELLVNIETANLSREEQHTIIIKPLYRAFSTVRGIEEIRSLQRENFCQLYLKYNWGIILSEAENELRDRIDGLINQLPNECSFPTISRLANSRVPLLKLNIRINQGVDNSIEEIILPKLNFVEGTGEITSIGTHKKGIQIEPDFQKLSLLNISISEFINSLLSHFESHPIAKIQEKGIQYPLFIKNHTQSLEAIEDLPIGPHGIPLKNLSQVSIGFEKPNSFFICDNQIGNLISIYGNGSSPVTTVKKLKKEINSLNLAYSHCFSIEILEDNSRILIQSIQNLLISLGIGLLSAFFIIWLFTHSLIASFITSLMIPIAFCISIFILGCFNKSLNLISLSGLAISCGMIIDNNIVVYDFLKQRKADLKDAFFAVIGSTLSTLIIFIPLFFIKGIVGSLFKDLAIIVSLTLLASVATSLFLLPLLLSFFPSIFAKSSQTFFPFLYNHYESCLSKLLTHPYRNAFLLSLPFYIPLLIIPQIQTQLVTTQKVKSCTFEFSFSPNDSTQHIMNESQKILAEISRPFSSKHYAIGGRELIISNFEPTLSSQSVQMTLSPLSANQIIKLKEFILSKPYASKLKAIYRPPQILESAIGSYHHRKEKIEALSLASSPLSQGEKIVISPRYQMLSHFGILPTDIILPLSIRLGKTLTNAITIDDSSFPLSIKNSSISTLDELQKLHLTIKGKDFTLSQICEIQFAPVFQDRFEINAIPYRLLEMDEKRGSPLYPNEFSGQLPNILLTSFFAILFLIAFLLYLFNEIKKPMLIVLLIPLSLPIAISSLLLFHQKLDLDAILAILILAGSGVNNSILLYQSKEKSLVTASEIAKIAQNRLRPILMTTLTTVVALFPFLFTHSMAPILCFGLFASTFLSLFVLPLLHPNLSSNHKNKKKVLNAF